MSELSTFCLVCNREIPYKFGRPKKFCSRECTLEWRRVKYGHSKLLRLSRKLAQVEIAEYSPVCECNRQTYAWTIEGVYCGHCGLEEPNLTMEVVSRLWIPAEDIPKPACICSHCKRSPMYERWLLA